MLNEKQIDMLESLPKRLPVGYEKKQECWWNDGFKKSASEHYGLGYNYFRKCASKTHGEPVSKLQAKLKAKCKHAHRSFRKAIEECVTSDLLTRHSEDHIYSGYKYKNQYVYVDEQGLIQPLKRCIEDVNDILHKKEVLSKYYPQYLDVARNLWDLRNRKERSDVFEYNHCMFKYIVRYNGLHYYVTNTDLSYEDIVYKYVPRLDATHHTVRENAKKVLCLSKMTVQELEYHGLIDIKENILLQAYRIVGQIKGDSNA